MLLLIKSVFPNICRSVARTKCCHCMFLQSTDAMLCLYVSYVPCQHFYVELHSDHTYMSHLPSQEEGLHACCEKGLFNCTFTLFPFDNKNYFMYPSVIRHYANDLGKQSSPTTLKVDVLTTFQSDNYHSPL